MLGQTLKNTRHGSLPGNGYGGFCIAAIQHPSPGFIIMDRRYCETCGKELMQHRFKSGRLEGLQQFKNRKYCNHKCSTDANIIEIPKKYCKTCGKELVLKQFTTGRWEVNYALSKRTYCNHDCMGQDKVKENVTQGSYYSRLLRSNIEKNNCEICKSTQNLCFHHKDQNVSNESRNNIMILCRRCHVSIHIKLGSYDKANEARKQRSEKCIICERPTFALDLCTRHYNRFRNNGDPFIRSKTGYNSVKRDFIDIGEIIDQKDILKYIKILHLKRGKHVKHKL